MNIRSLFRIAACFLLLALICSGDAALAAPKAVTDYQMAETETGFSYSFRCERFPYLLLDYQTSNESGTLVLTGKEGAYEGIVALGYSRNARKLKVQIKLPSGMTLHKAEQKLAFTAAPAVRKDDAQAAAKVKDLSLTPGKKQVSFRFTAPGHHQVMISVTSVTQRIRYILNETENGVFSDTVSLPCANAKDNVTVSVKTLKGKKLAQDSVRLPFVPPDAGVTAEKGPLKGVKVCIDPGHQELEVHGGLVYQYPGSTDLVSGGNSTMAQGVMTARKESIAVLEISYRICRRMRALGAEVVMTRWVEEVSITNMERAEYANEQGADYCLRIHLNYSPKGTNNAVYVYGPRHSPYAKAVMPFEQYRNTAQTILDGMKAATGVAGGTVRMNDAYVGNNYTRMPTFLLECGFLSTPANDWILTTDDYQEKIAAGITDGLVNVVEGRLSKWSPAE